MRRRRLYIVLLVLLFVCIAAKNQSLFTREQVKKGKEPGTFNGGWYSLISKEVNDKRIKLKIDGRKVKAKKGLRYYDRRGEFMVPVSFYRIIFHVQPGFMTIQTGYGKEYHLCGDERRRSPG